ncbi:hypothetical protein Bca4012_091605 [Brassica carinata]|uniref:Uncharacterized protein n=1 Tax=Brassica carinata TaxID=52824 RepID=A0A8X7TJA8_BRACI|nr:hypothetical protein Bca52824_094059 [Brassica carinata]
MSIIEFLHPLEINSRFAPGYDEENISSKKIVDPDTNADAFQDSMLNEIFDNATDTRPTGLHKTRIKAAG